MLESTAKSEMDRWIVRVKLAKLGTVNSTEHRNPKEPRLQAAQNIQSSCELRSRDCRMISMMLSVIGGQ